MIPAKRHAKLRPNFEIRAWKYMRLSAILLVPLVWIHTIIITLIIGAEHVSLDFVAMRWANIGWRVYDILLLAFAFSHGVNGLRQVLLDFTSSSISRKILNILLLFFWLILSIIGAAGILGGIE
jgi:succinate dehydrogenase / fumarate reductase membrane anchor subunit